MDEVHERDSASDFLLTVVKRALAKRPNLKLILMSATADVELFRYQGGTTNILTSNGL